MSMFDDDETCPEERNATKLYIGVFILLGLILSYAPQLGKIHKIRSSEGLSPYFLGLGLVGTAATWLNTLMLQFAAMQCCQTHWSPAVCFENTLGFTQMSVQAVPISSRFVLFYIYFPPYLKYPDSPRRIYGPAYTTSLWVLVVCISYIIASVAISAVTLVTGAGDPNRTAIEGVAGIWGGVATLTGVVQFIPQIWHTFWLGHPGALSVETLIMQCPGSFLFAYSLAIQPRTNWTSWLPFFVGGILQFVLLALCTYFICRNPAVIDSEERERLLGSIDEEVIIPDAVDNDGADGVDAEDEARSPSPSAPPVETRLDQGRPRSYQTMGRAKGKKARRDIGNGTE
ncbi:hypothetical protein SmJEL517_g05927 [Synchytrium microbalum]|uniref:PQ loop repeat protein n=1 Tax=Synchytrium microbalum TaxID=1806994 RepID=A0A507BIJ5_9FUNG|nr:uncharacterized protein SmJEL517_g05927 [Synchytrium microbalum]TPX30540.1 hypothetical protein SmJEL517_g05927 [Synchytrium microbalum]